MLLRQLNLALLPDWISKLMHVQLFTVIQEESATRVQNASRRRLASRTVVLMIMSSDS